MGDVTRTRTALLDAAAELFSTMGIDKVSNAAIVRQAGQRNVSAINYHFGDRIGLITALLARSAPEIAVRRREILATEMVGADELAHVAAEAIVRPLTELAARGWRERAYLQIGSELADAPGALDPKIKAVMGETAGPVAWKLLRRSLPDVPDDIWRERQDICISMIARAAAERARRLDAGPAPEGVSNERYVDNLIAMLLGAMGAPTGGA